MAINKQLGTAEITRLKELVIDGVRTLEEITSLREGMADTVKAISSELDLPAPLLKKVIAAAHKGNLQEMETELSDVEQLLKLAGK